MKLLIAEDDKTSRLILSSVCKKKWGDDVVVAENGQVAWQLIQDDTDEFKGTADQLDDLTLIELNR